MTISTNAAAERDVVPDHGFHRLRVAAVRNETSDAVTLTLDVPADQIAGFDYRAGQFLTLRVWIDGRPHLRSYSMSSAPRLDPDLRVTVKRVPGGLVSNWINDTVRPGDVVEATCPAGVFCLGAGEQDVVAFAAGSGITPVISVLRTALATPGRNVRLLYANRDRDSVIFATDIDQLLAQHPERFRVVHRYDVDAGFVDEAAVRQFAADQSGGEHFICGPAPFMDVVERTLTADGIPDGCIHIERFTPEAPRIASDLGTGSRITIEIDGRVESVDHRPGTTILQTARQLGLAPPFSCEAGNCATCMAKVEEGAATMLVNNALTEDEVAAGWVLTCQAVPASPSVRVVYGLEAP